MASASSENAEPVVLDEEEELRLKSINEVKGLRDNVLSELAERHKLEEEFQSLELENAKLKAYLYELIQGRTEAFSRERKASVLNETAPPVTDADTSMLATASFLSSANAALRAGLFGVLSDKRDIVLDISDLSKDERAEVDWVINTEGHFSHELTKNPFRADVASIAMDWKKTVGGAHLAGNETVIEDVNDSVQANRGLLAELATQHQTGSHDDVLADAIENYGFARNSDGSAPVYDYDEEDSPTNIVMETAPGTAGPATIKCATLTKLVERVTHEKYVDLNTRYVFLLTYHSFTTASDVIRKLGARYDVPIPPNVTHEEVQYFKQTKLDRVQIRVCSVLKNWLDEHYDDFANAPALKAQLQELLVNMIEKSASALSTQLAKGLLTLIKKKEKTPTRRIIANDKFPKALISSKVTVDTFSFEAVNELEIARQLTLMDFDKFRSIQPRECLNQAWSKKDKETRAPNIIAMIDQFNKVSVWVQLLLVSEPDVNKRAACFKKLLRIAEKCRELNNFNSLFAIYCGLSANAIHRLRKTKELVGAKLMKVFDGFKELFRQDKNSRNFRRVLQTTLTPCIPHLGIFLSDLTFIEDGNPDDLHGMINFYKRAKLAERIRWIKQYQQEGYQLAQVAVIQEYFKKHFKIVDAETLWKMSLEVEAREPQNN